MKSKFINATNLINDKLYKLQVFILVIGFLASALDFVINIFSAKQKYLYF